MLNASRHSSRGSTVIEVLMAISLVAIGASGVMAMQKVTVSANRNAKDLEVANEIARTWAERMRADSMKWRFSGDTDLSNTIWITQQWSTGKWFLPAYAGGLFPSVSGMHNALGKDWAGDPETHPFCANVRLIPMDSKKPPMMIRADVRVYWLKQGMGGWANAPSNLGTYLCSDPVAADVESATVKDYFHIIHITTMLFRNQQL